MSQLSRYIAFETWIARGRKKTKRASYRSERQNFQEWLAVDNLARRTSNIWVGERQSREGTDVYPAWDRRLAAYTVHRNTSIEVHPPYISLNWMCSVDIGKMSTERSGSCTLNIDRCRLKDPHNVAIMQCNNDKVW